MADFEDCLDNYLEARENYEQVGSHYGFACFLEARLEKRALKAEIWGNPESKQMQETSKRLKLSANDLEGKLKWKYIRFQRSWIALRNKALEQGMKADELKQSLTGLKLE